jgi:hypothetical protein
LAVSCEFRFAVDNNLNADYHQRSMLRLIRFKFFVFVVLVLLWTGLLPATTVFSQTTQKQKAEVGSTTAKNGFKNEDEIAAKFNNWKIDSNAQKWLAAMGYSIRDIRTVTASKPHGEKADVEVRIETISKTKTEGISIKLVSGPNGFNQIDKRWLSHYAKMWQMPAEVYEALKLFTGEAAPTKPGKVTNRMFLNEISDQQQKAVVSFFERNKQAIASDFFQGDGAHAADWVMVAFKATPNTRWTLRRIDDVI